MKRWTLKNKRTFIFLIPDGRLLNSQTFLWIKAPICYDLLGHAFCYSWSFFRKPPSICEKVSWLENIKDFSYLKIYISGIIFSDSVIQWRSKSLLYTQWPLHMINKSLWATQSLKHLGTATVHNPWARRNSGNKSVDHSEARKDLNQVWLVHLLFKKKRKKRQNKKRSGI